MEKSEALRVAIEVGEVITGLHGAYRIEGPHGEGAFGVAYRAVETASSARVIVKVLRVERLGDWKALDLFEREARVLASLSHASIPAFRDFFVHGGAAPLPVSSLHSDDAPKSPSLVLVQELIMGSTLEQKVERGERLSSVEAEAVLRSLLRALDYLHGRTPPLVHRDIKPSNVVLTPDGRPTLIDFGAIQDRLGKAGSAGSTIVGTVGYMPLEQTRGEARPASDLYALGVTMVVALAGRPLSELPFDDSTGRIAIVRAVPEGTSPALRATLHAMTAPLLGQRTSSAAEALARLDAAPARSRSLLTHTLAACVGAAAATVTTLLVAPHYPPPRAVEEPMALPAPLPPPIAPVRPQMAQQIGRASPDRSGPTTPAAPDSVEGTLRASGKHWRQVGGEVSAGDYVEDILVGRLNQPAGRGDVAKVLSVTTSPTGRAAAKVDFGRGHTPGIFLTELARLKVTDS